MLLVVLVLSAFMFPQSSSAAIMQIPKNLNSTESKDSKLRGYNCQPGYCDTSYATCCEYSTPNYVYAPTCFNGCFRCPPGSCSAASYSCDIIADITCAAGKYLTTPTSGACGSCTACPTTCPAGQYLSRCGGTSAGACTTCSTTCPAGQYLSGCSGTSSGTCTACSTSLPARNRAHRLQWNVSWHLRCLPTWIL